MSSIKTAFQILNARDVKSYNTSLLPHKEDGSIKALCHPDGEIAYTQGGLFSPKTKVYYRSNIISQINGRHGLVGYLFSIAELNSTSIFALPMLGDNRSLFLWDSNFVNAFIEYEDTPCLALLYRFSANPMYMKFEEGLKEHPNFQSMKDIDRHHVLYIFSIPYGCEEWYNKYKESKYSQIGDFDKMKILTFHGFENNGLIARILRRDPDLRTEIEKDLSIGNSIVELPFDAEVYSAIDEKKEIFNIDYYQIKPVL